MQPPATALDAKISEAINNDPYVGQRQLRFESHDGRVILRGDVTSYYQKQMAQEALRRVDGVSAIENQIEVIWA